MMEKPTVSELMARMENEDVEIKPDGSVVYHEKGTFGSEARKAFEEEQRAKQAAGEAALNAAPASTEAT